MSDTTYRASVAHAFSLISGVPMFGDDTFGMIAPFAAFMTGQEAPCLREPEFEDVVAYRAYFIWYSAILHTTVAEVFGQLCLFYPDAARLQKMDGLQVGLEDDLDEYLADIMRRIEARGVDLLREFDFTPLPPDEQAETARLIASATFRRECEKTILRERSRQLVSA